MKTVKAIRDLFGKEIDLHNLEILATGKDWVMAKRKGYGFIKVYNYANRYTIEFED